jgi:hypothetical protein
MTRFRKLSIGLGVIAVTGSGALLAANGVGASVDPLIGANGVSGHAVTPKAHEVSTCDFTNDSGTPVTTISIDKMQGGDSVYWMQYTPAVDETGTMTFTLTGPSGSPFTTEVQTFDTAGLTVAPFGVPYWGDNLTSGTYKLSVKAKGNSTAKCSVTAS